MRAEQNVEREVRATLDKLLELYKTGDTKGLLEIFSKDSDVTIIGTQPDSKHIGLEDIKAHFEKNFDPKGKISEFNYDDLIVSGNESIAWISANLNIQFPTSEGTIKIFARLTAVFQFQENKWKVAQLHYSMPTALAE